MNYVVDIAIPRPVERLYTYSVPDHFLDEVEVGRWVRVPFGRGQTHGFILSERKSIEELESSIDPSKLKEITEIGQSESRIPENLLNLCYWARDYYQAPLGEVLNYAVPASCLGLRSAKREAREILYEHSAATSTDEDVQLTEEQALALNSLKERLSSGSKEMEVSLLRGVTGSGKTEIYIRLAREALALGKSVIVLVPEIALTPQLYSRFETGLDEPVALWHSALSDGKRRDYWSALRQGKIRVVVGARSAVFAPVENLGLIVVDEEHDPSYKQEERFRYQARDLAVVRAKQSSALAVLGSATPSLETRERVREGRFSEEVLRSRATGSQLPGIELVRLGEEPLVSGIRTPLAEKTVDAIRGEIEAGNQVMVFLNRRGFAAFSVCEDCGESIGCPDCSISLTVHKRFRQLRCHICAHSQPIASVCPHCNSDRMNFVGSGTESLEDELPQVVPGIIPVRLDRDQITSVGRLEKVLADFREGRANVLLGTQMLVKGHDFPRVTLVVVILADGLFRWPDFRATERAFQVLTQVAGRAGRADRLGRVLIQAYADQHPVLETITSKRSEEDLYSEERELRQSLSYPPFGRLTRLRLEDRNQDAVQARANQIAASLREAITTGELQVELLGPSQAFVERVRGIYRWDLLLKSARVEDLQRVIRHAKALASANKWTLLVDVDPNGVG